MDHRVLSPFTTSGKTGRPDPTAKFVKIFGTSAARRAAGRILLKHYLPILYHPPNSATSRIPDKAGADPVKTLPAWVSPGRNFA